MTKHSVTRRIFLEAAASVTAAALLHPGLAFGQDVEFIRALEQAQSGRPAELTPSARIAPASESGVPLVIRGQVFAADGRTALPGAVVFAYHTDREGLYDRPGVRGHSWRLKGWAKTGADGRFEFRTIRPGAYPERSVASHVHFTVFAAGGGRFHAGELQFEDDTLVPQTDRERSRQQGDFGSVRPVRQENGTQQVDVRLKVEPRQRF